MDPGLAGRTVVVTGGNAKIGRRTLLERQTAFPSEIAAAAVYLASEGAAFVTGQVLAVDGGTQLA